MDQTIIESIAYEFGELKKPYTSVPNHKEIFESNNYPNMPELFGWGDYHKSKRDIFDLGITSAKRSLSQSLTKPNDIDAVFFCSTCFPGNEIDYISFNTRILRELNLSDAFLIGVTLNNCVSFLSSIMMACKLVECGTYKNILVITADKVYDENARLNNFALLSDSSASCIVSKSEASGYALISESFKSSDDPIDSYKGKDDPSLYLKVMGEVLTKADTNIENIQAVLSNNIFKPITQQKERKLGFSKAQLYQKNVLLHGHCFSADTLINLLDYSQDKDINNGALFMLSSDAPNLRASLVLKFISNNHI